MNEKSKPLISRLYEVEMPGYKTTTRAVSEEHARVWAEMRYLKHGFTKDEIKITEVPGEEEPISAVSEKVTTVTESQLKAISNMVNELFEQRSSLDMDNGTEKEVLDKGTEVLRFLKASLTSPTTTPQHDEI